MNAIELHPHHVALECFKWKQVDGDMNPSQYGAIIATSNGHVIELLEIQPVREYVSESEALEIGCPFWSREAYYEVSELSPLSEHVQKAIECCGLDLDEFDGPRAAEARALAIAVCLMRYGYRVDEGPAGFAKDVLGDTRVEWWGRQGKRPVGWRYLADEDREYRAMQREAEKQR